MRWVFLCGRPFLAAGDDPFAAGLGGTEQAVLHLTEALAARGHAVSVVGGSLAERVLGRVRWLPPGAELAADVAVAVNDAGLLPAGLAASVVWFHNEVELLREWRKGRFGALWRRRPWAVFIGREQARLASRLLPFGGRRVIPYGLPARVMAAPVRGDVPAPRAVFTSQAYRGLAEVIAIWRKRVQPAVPAARLSAFVADGDLARYGALAEGCPGIEVRGRIGNSQVLETLLAARVVLVPGHRSETFCMAAAEAVALGVPVVTLGTGSLKERVRDGVDGFVCRDWGGFAEATVSVLRDDALWLRLHRRGLETRIGASWNDAALRWEQLAERITGRPSD